MANNENDRWIYQHTDNQYCQCWCCIRKIEPFNILELPVPPPSGKDVPIYKQELLEDHVFENIGTIGLIPGDNTRMSSETLSRIVHSDNRLLIKNEDKTEPSDMSEFRWRKLMERRGIVIKNETGYIEDIRYSPLSKEKLEKCLDELDNYLRTQIYI